METYVVFICHSQNNRHHNGFGEYKLYGGRHWNYWIKSSFSIILIIHECYGWIFIIIKKKEIRHYWIASICFASILIILRRLSSINMFCSFGETRGVTIDFEIVISILCFRLRPQRVRACPFHCDVESFDWDRRKSQTMHISNFAS